MYQGKNYQHFFEWELFLGHPLIIINLRVFLTKFKIWLPLQLSTKENTLFPILMLLVILLSMLMILLPTVSVIRDLICGNNWSWLLSSNLTWCWLRTWCRHCRQDRKLLVDFNVGKIQLVSLERSYNSSPIDIKMDGSGLEEKLFLSCWVCL